MEYLQSISASAGSGKTFALALRYIALLSKGAKTSSILALTFTKKAAFEMRERIASQLEALSLGDTLLQGELLKAGGNLECDFSKLRDEFLRGEDRISTIDSFFNSVLRKFCFYAGIRGDYTILGSSRESFLEFLLGRLSRDRIDRCATFCRFLRMDLDRFVELLEGFDSSNRELLYAFTHKAGDYALLSSIKSEIYITLQSINEFISRDKSASKSALNAFGYEDCDSFLQKVKKSPPSWLSKESLSEYSYTKKLQNIEYQDENLRKIKELLREQFLLEERMRLSMLGEFYREFREIKREFLREQNRLDFIDVQDILFEVLGENSIDNDFLYFRLDGNIEHILIDEFQDTNISQYKLLLPLVEEIKSGIGRSGFRSFFIVGDKKQSIYRFRGANPHLFDYVAKDLNKRYLLSNYRSASNIVEFVNSTFAAKIEGYKPQSAIKEGGYVRVVKRAQEELINELKSIIDDLLNTGVASEDIAILSFKNEDLEFVGDSLDRLYEGCIPFVTDLSSRLIYAKEVRSIISALRFFYTGERLYREEFLALTGVDISEFAVRFGSAELGTKNRFETLCSDGSKSDSFGVSIVSNRIEKAVFSAKLKPGTSPFDIVIALIKEFGLSSQDSLRFAEIASSYDELGTFLEEAWLLSESIVSKSSSGIKLQTIHKSKGLDYGYVILLDALSGEFSGNELINPVYEGLELREITLRISGRELVDREYALFLEEKKKERVEDRLNTLYVGFTRAKHGLIVLSKDTDSRFEIVGLEETAKGAVTPSSRQDGVVAYDIEEFDFLETPLGLQEDYQKEGGYSMEHDFEAITFGLALHKAFESSDEFTVCERTKEIVYGRYGLLLKHESMDKIEGFFRSFKESELYREILSMYIYKEISFASPSGSGRIDMLALGEDKAVVIDYKSGHRADTLYKKQIERYKRGIEEITGLRCEGYLIYFVGGELFVEGGVASSRHSDEQ